MPSKGKLRNHNLCEHWSLQHGSGAGGRLVGDVFLQDRAGGGTTEGRVAGGPAGLQQGKLGASETSAREPALGS